MPKLSKAAGNQQNHRITIPDEIVAWCGWETTDTKPVYVDIVRCEEPVIEVTRDGKNENAKTSKVVGVKRYLKLENMDVDNEVLSNIWKFAKLKAAQNKEEAEKKEKEDKAQK